MNNWLAYLLSPARERFLGGKKNLKVTNTSGFAVSHQFTKPAPSHRLNVLGHKFTNLYMRHFLSTTFHDNTKCGLLLTFL